MKNRAAYPSWMPRLAALLLVIYPSLMLTVRGGMNGIFIITLAIALYAWPFRVLAGGLFTRREIQHYALAMVGLTIATFISESYWQQYSGRSYDAIARYWLALPIFFWLSHMHSRVFRSLEYAFPLAAIVGALLTDMMWGRFGISTLDLIHFGDIELVLGVLSLFSINWFGRDSVVLKIIKIIGFAVGIVVSFESGSRGGWLAMPLLLIIFFYFNHQRWSIGGMLAGLLLTIAGMSGLYTFSYMVNLRVDQMVSDIKYYQEGNLDTSVGIRWQLYGAAVEIFSEHPIVGVGPNGFAQKMQPMQEAGKLTPEAANIGQGEVHNDILSKAAGMGLFGLISILALYVIPFRMFWKATLASRRSVKRAGILGITFVCSIGIFGLTVEFLNLTMAAAFYSFTVAVLLAACNSMHAEAMAKERAST